MDILSALSELFLLLFSPDAPGRKSRLNLKAWISSAILIALILLLVLNRHWFSTPHLYTLVTVSGIVSVLLTATIFRFLNRKGILYHLRFAPAIIYFLTGSLLLSTLIFYCNHYFRWL